jgi:hypothetical protein
MLRKLSIIFIRLVPVLLAVKILILLLAEYFVVSSLLIGLVSYIISILFEFSLTNIVFISSFLCLTIIVIFLVVYTYLRYGDKKQW